MTYDKVDRAAKCIFLAAITENNIGTKLDLTQQEVIARASKQVKRDIIEFAIDVLQDIGREINADQSVQAEIISNKIKTLEEFKWK